MPAFKPALFVSCEHASLQIPSRYRYLFKNARKVLTSHRGYDMGSAGLARYLSREFSTDLLVAHYSRLLVDLNRSECHINVFSEFTANLCNMDKQDILDNFYRPYRQAVSEKIDNMLHKSSIVLHLSVHSFTPVLDGEQRNADIGLLYDPKRELEKSFCIGWQQSIRELTDDLKVRRNYPYQGSANGLTTAMRKLFPAKKYMGIELELNQKLFRTKGKRNFNKTYLTLGRGLEQTLRKMAGSASQ